MIDFVVEKIIDNYLKKYNEKEDEKVIIEEYLLPEAVNNLYELAKIKTINLKIQYNIFDVVNNVDAESFEVGNFNFPFIFLKLKYSSFEDFKENIKLSRNEEIVFFRKLYRIFKLVEEKKDLNRFTMGEYKEFSEVIKLAINKFDIKTRTYV